MKRSKPGGLSVKARYAAPPTIQDDLISSLALVLKQTESLFRQVLPVAEKMRDNTAAMIHLLHEQQRTEEYRQQQQRVEASHILRQADAKQNSAESALLEWFRKNAPEQLDPTGSAHLYTICLRIAAEWHRLRLEYRHQP
jgi:hypothetical protein